MLHARRSVCCCASAAQLLPVHKSADSLATDKSIHMMNSRRFDSYFMAEANSVDLMQSSQSLSGSPSSRAVIVGVMHSFDILLVLCGSPFQSCSDKQAIDCLRQAGWVVEGGIEVFYTSGMQVRVHGVATSAEVCGMPPSTVAP